MSSLQSPEAIRVPVIALIEDNASLARLMKLHLERSGYTVLGARDGRDGLEMVIERRPDLILLDVDLPTMNGFQILDTIKKDERTRRIPVIMLTAHAKDDKLFEEWADKLDSFIAKPCTPSDLIATVQRTLTAKSQPPDEP